MTEMLEDAKKIYYDMAGKILVKTNADVLFRIIQAEDEQRKQWANELRACFRNNDPTDAMALFTTQAVIRSIIKELET